MRQVLCFWEGGPRSRAVLILAYLDVDHCGRIYIADSHSVQIFGPDEKYLYSLCLGAAMAVALEAQDNRYVLSYPATVPKLAALPEP